MSSHTNNLPLRGQNIYTQLVKYIESYKREFVFPNESFDYVSEIYDYVLLDHPEFFWLCRGCRGRITNYGDRTDVTLIPEYKCDISQINGMRVRFDNAVSEMIFNAKNHSPVLYEQILYIHDSIVRKTDYQSVKPYCYDAYGCLVLHRAVCAGYSLAFEVLMQKLGVECGYVSGSSLCAGRQSSSHAWNYIKLSDGYYYVDVTWDDPTIIGETGDNLSHDYFCLDMNEIKLTHSFGENRFIPTMCGTRYNYFVYHGMHLDRYSFSAVQDMARKQLKYSDKLYIKFDSRSAAEEALRELIDNNKVFSLPGFSGSVSYGLSESGLILHICRK